jgi:hypothetical protein
VLVVGVAGAGLRIMHDELVAAAGPYAALWRSWQS